MKLPEDSEERKKIFMLIGIGVAAACYVLYSFGISPYLQHKQEKRAKIEELEGKIWRAQLDVRKTKTYLQENNDVIAKIIDVSENKLQILHPNLGNYLLVASDIINRQADNLNLVTDEIREIPAPKKLDEDQDPDADDAPRFNTYKVNVNIKCSFAELTQLLQALENENPYLCITRIGVVGQKDDVMKHAISFDVEWPTWVNSKQPIKLVAQQMIAKSAKE